MASAVARAYTGGLGVEPPAGSTGRAPGQGSGGKAPLKLKHFWLLDVHWKPQICPLFETYETQRHHMLSLQKIMGGHETGGGAGARLGLCPPVPA